MTIKEKIAVRLLLFAVRICLTYSYNEEFKQMAKEIGDLIAQEEKK